MPCCSFGPNTLVADANGALIVDGSLVNVNDRILVKNQVDPKDNGIYIVCVAGDAGTPWVLQRASDMETTPQTLQGLFVRASEGTTNALKYFRLTTQAPIILNVTGLTWTEIPKTVTIESY